jgi:hypothetical protein
MAADRFVGVTAATPKLPPDVIAASQGTTAADLAAGNHTHAGGGGVPTTRLIATTAPLSGGGDLSADRTLAVAAFTQTVPGVVPAPVTLGGRVLRDDGVWWLIPQATTAVMGLVAMATTAEVAAGVSTSSAVSPLTLRDGRRLGVVTTAATSGAFGLTNENQLSVFTAPTAITLTMPANATVAFAIGARLDIAQTGAGRITVAPAGGVTITGTPSLTLRAAGSVASLVKIGTDAWLLTGDLA